MMNFSFLKAPYNREHWKSFIRHVFPSESDFFTAPQTFPELHSERIQSFVQFGNIHQQDDRFGPQLVLFEVMLKPNTTKLQIYCVALRETIERLRRNTTVTRVFVVFADPATDKWRFTFIAKQEIFGEKTLGLVVERDKSVVVLAPTGTSRETLDAFVDKKRFWLFEKINYSPKFGEPKQETPFISGKAIPYLGKNYKLDVVKNPMDGMSFQGKFLLSHENLQQGKAILEQWYKQKAKRKSRHLWSDMPNS